MSAKTYSAANFGISAKHVEIEVDTSPGIHSFHIVGLPDTTVKEAKERISSAIKNSGFSPPQHSNRKVIFNLAPADLKKEGSGYDLAMAISYLLSSEQIKIDNPDSIIFLGELSLDGKLRPIKGALAATLLAKKKKQKTIILPTVNVLEASLIDGIDIIGAQTLTDVIMHLTNQSIIAPAPLTNINQYLKASEANFDFGHIKGQAHAKRALQIAAAGNHNILLSGPPGSGKSLLAKSLVSILPDMTLEELLEITSIWSIAGALPENNTILSSRPFRQPHHTASIVALIGGGADIKPGEITLAHHGVLFLDELPEFPRSALEALRQPLENREITVSRASATINFPAKFIFIGAMNPCPCGNASNPHKPCICSPGQVTKYKNRLSGPLLDRIDLHLEVPPVKNEELLSTDFVPESKQIKKLVENARQIQRDRFRHASKTNNELSTQDIKKYCQATNQANELIKNALTRMHLSARAYHKMLKVARTIADLENSEQIDTHHIAEALQYRPKDNL